LIGDHPDDQPLGDGGEFDEAGSPLVVDLRDDFGLSGNAIEINSEAVTNLNPFASSWAIAAGIASIVPG
jgi:hypothetical protein